MNTGHGIADTKNSHQQLGPNELCWANQQVEELHLTIINKRMERK